MYTMTKIRMIMKNCYEAMNPGEVGRIWGFIAHSAAILETRKDGAPAQRQKVHFLLCHGPVQTSVPAPTNFAYREKSTLPKSPPVEPATMA